MANIIAAYANAQGGEKLEPEEDTVAKGRITAIVVVFVACVPLAHSGDFLEATSELAGRWQPSSSPLLIVVDVLILALIAVLTSRLWPRLGVIGGWRRWKWWAGERY
jgi:hypothetical protein